jgi:hypothetical protein
MKPDSSNGYPVERKVSSDFEFRENRLYNVVSPRPLTGYSPAQLGDSIEVRMQQLEELATKFKRNGCAVPLSVYKQQAYLLRQLNGLPEMVQQKSPFLQSLSGPIEYRALV